MDDKEAVLLIATSYAVVLVLLAARITGYLP